jgi:hypothetical protein
MDYPKVTVVQYVDEFSPWDITRTMLLLSKEGFTELETSDPFDSHIILATEELNLSREDEKYVVEQFHSMEDDSVLIEIECNNALSESPGMTKTVELVMAL